MIFLSKFAVGVRFSQYRASRHRFNISYKDGTKVSITEDGKIPLHGWHLILYNELASASENEMHLVGILLYLAIVIFCLF